MGKTLITKANKKPVKFLGTLISWNTVGHKKVTLTKAKVKTRVTARIYLKAPLENILSKLITRKFAKWNPSGNRIIPTGLKRLQNLDHADIITYYNAIVRGIVNYYSFADNRSSLGSIVRLLHMSCARTLALKYKLRHVAKAYKQFGKLLTCPDKDVSLYKPNIL